MKSAIRMFALLVAIAGLASASFAPATTQPMPRHASASASGPGPLNLPGPLPCESDGTCRPRLEGIANSTERAVASSIYTKVPAARYPFVFGTLGWLALSLGRSRMAP